MMISTRNKEQTCQCFQEQARPQFQCTQPSVKPPSTKKKKKTTSRTTPPQTQKTIDRRRNRNIPPSLKLEGLLSSNHRGLVSWLRIHWQVILCIINVDLQQTMEEIDKFFLEVRQKRIEDKVKHEEEKKQRDESLKHKGNHHS